MPVRLTQLYHCVFVNTPSEFRWRFISCFVFVLCLLSLVLCHPCVVLWQTNVRVILYFCAVRSIPYRFVTRASSLTCSLFVFGVIIFLCCPPLSVSRALSLHTILIIRYFLYFSMGSRFWTNIPGGLQQIIFRAFPVLFDIRLLRSVCLSMRNQQKI